MALDVLPVSEDHFRQPGPSIGECAMSRLLRHFFCHKLPLVARQDSAIHWTQGRRGVVIQMDQPCAHLP